MLRARRLEEIIRTDRDSAPPSRLASGQPLHFPPGFLWGAATSAHQVEGGNRWNDWWRFEQQAGKIAAGDVSGPACRHYDLFDQDFALAARDGHNAHRLSIEWSRLEPERGQWNAREVDHYHQVFASLARHRLLPCVTLHHFTNPLWIADEGGWERRETVDRFARFVEFCAREYGGEVDWWCTVNEPDVYAFRAYSEGAWPPGRRNDSAALAVMANLLEAHGRAYRILHAEDRSDADGDGRPAVVGFAKHYPILEPARPWFPLDRLRARVEQAVFNQAVLEAPCSGEIRLSIPGARAVRRHVPELAGSLDYIGLNYYSRWLVRMFSSQRSAPRGAAVNDLGWEIYPAGIGAVVGLLERLAVPVVVLENGVADASDALRPRALIETLIHLGAAIERGARVLGYFHWSLIDNVEWSEGYRARFGLYHVDFDHPARSRTARRSAGLYARVARGHAIDQSLWRETTAGSAAPAALG
jgi:beta-glucosidase